MRLYVNYNEFMKKSNFYKNVCKNFLILECKVIIMGTHLESHTLLKVVLTLPSLNKYKVKI